jgi:hypothetical protein
MSEVRSGGREAVNWRGPLLATGVFAAAFAILLVMARQNESNTTDMGSSLRQDPYGTSLLFDSYARAGYQVERSQDEDSLSDQNASRTTAFFIGGSPDDEFETVNGKPQRTGKFSRRVEEFLGRGGRVVLVAPTWQLKSESQGWQVESWGAQQNLDQAAPAWAAPDPAAMPRESEMMYLTDEAPWLKTDANWTPLYRGPADSAGKTSSANNVYMAVRRVGSGELVAASQESFLLNEAVKTHPNPVLLDFLTGGRPTLWVDETLHGLQQDEGVLWLIQRYRLEAALLLFWAALLILLWSLSGDLVRRPALDWSAEIIRTGERAGVAGQRLLQRSIPSEQVVAECWEQFRRRSPQDAQAISADPHWRPRLRAALEQPPLAGYKELTKLIAERRASSKGLAPRSRDDRFRGPAAPNMTSEEARFE